MWESPCVGSLRGTAWDPKNFSHQLNPHRFLQAEVTGSYLPGTGTLGRRALCGSGTPRSCDIPLEFLSTTCAYGTSPFLICAPPSYPSDGCGFFNSIIFKLAFNSIPDGSEWWLFYILAVILMWLCEEASHVYLCRHLEWKSLQITTKKTEELILWRLQIKQNVLFYNVTLWNKPIADSWLK